MAHPIAQVTHEQRRVPSWRQQYFEFKLSRRGETPLLHANDPIPVQSSA